MDGITAIVAILLASFAIDRVVTGLTFLLDFLKPWRRWFPVPALLEDKEAQLKAERKRTLLYFGLATVLALGVLAGYGQMSILASVGFGSIKPWVDKVLTGLILVGGADRVADILKLGKPGGGQAKPREPIQITGRLVLDKDSNGLSVEGNP